jgi:hypothetical protein
MSKHTPGPWGIRQYSAHTGFSVWGGGRGSIAERWYDGPQAGDYGPEIEANARLIAAAPDLLAACKLYAELDDTRRKGKFIDPGVRAKLDIAIRAAIAKAEWVCAQRAEL